MYANSLNYLFVKIMSLLSSNFRIC